MSVRALDLLNSTCLFLIDMRHEVIVCGGSLTSGQLIRALYRLSQDKLDHGKAFHFQLLMFLLSCQNIENEATPWTCRFHVLFLPFRSFRKGERHAGEEDQYSSLMFIAIKHVVTQHGSFLKFDIQGTHSNCIFKFPVFSLSNRKFSLCQFT